MAPPIFPPPSGFLTHAVEAILTAAGVARLPRTLATTDVDYELHDGRSSLLPRPVLDMRFDRIGSAPLCLNMVNYRDMVSPWPSEKS